MVTFSTNCRSVFWASVRGVAYWRLGQLDRALADHDRATSIDPQLAIAYNNRAFALAAAGRIQESLADANRCVELSPELSNCYGTRGQTLYLFGNFSDAIIDYNKSIELDPPGAYGLIGKAVALYAIGDAEGAEDAWRDAFEAKEFENVDAYVNLYAPAKAFEDAMRELADSYGN